MPKKIIALILAASLAVCAAGCSREKKKEGPVSSAASSLKSNAPASSEEEKQEEGTPAAAADAMLKAFKNVEMEQLKEAIEDENIKALAGNAQGLIKSLSKNMSYELGETKIEGDAATVHAVITNRDFSGVAEQLLPTLVAIALKNPNASQEEMGGLILDELAGLVENAGKEAVSAEVDIQLVQENGEWKIRQQLPKELLDAVSGGLFGAFLNMADQLGALAG